MILIYMVLLLFPIQIHSECGANQNSRNTYLWSISDKRKGLRGFLFGTIHVPYTQVWNSVSERVKEAFSLSDYILLEVNLHDNETLLKLAKCKNLPRKQTARKYLSEELYEKIESIIKTYQSNRRKQERKTSGSSNVRRKSNLTWQKKRPEWLLFILQQIFMNSSNNQSPILDIFLAQTAIEQSKRVGPIETIEEQCNPISSISTDDIIFAITQTVKYLEYMKATKSFTSTMHNQQLQDLIENYKCGQFEENTMLTKQFNFPGINMTTKESMRTQMINDALKNDIITMRNVVMAERLNDILMSQTNSIIFTAVGLGHYFGETTIIHYLRLQGYLIQSIDINHKIGANNVQRVKSMWKKESERMNFSVHRFFSLITTISFIFLCIVL